ncbi:hypothetical protein GEOBRER4_n0752 [Citrifermentans bremense]|uniref:NRDE family protein n=1 Tax=Citrifermentans bremense TaxID=60035 RepID=A0A6S6LVH3_9BACT|nr:NRDE family protein [Citrifermentans bremense]BCG45977.1 hypothetical protein GEOBRER4_n0752 [Citrifermentans bremense]
MCTLLLAYRAHPRYPLVLLANRDEYYQRPTARASFWEDAPQLFGGRDLLHGGTWLGITTTGRIAALTNYRDPADLVRQGLSRGRLVSGFLKGVEDAEGYLECLRAAAGPFGGYNLVVGTPMRLHCYSSKTDEAVQLEPGIHGLSNRLLNTPWPKVVRGTQALKRALGAGEPDLEELFAILADRTHPPDDQLPDTGVGLELERLLSPIFIESERYGTCSSSVLLVGRDGEARFVERSLEQGRWSEAAVTMDWSAVLNGE